MTRKSKYAIGIALVAVTGATLSFTLYEKEKPAKSNMVETDGIDSDCTYKGFKLYGKVQIVDAFPDVKVQIVDAFPDLKVQVVSSFPDDCGEWQFVDAFPDVKVQIVDAFPDVKIQYVSSFPGKP